MESSSVLAAVALLWQLPRKQGPAFRSPDPGCPVKAALRSLAQLVAGAVRSLLSRFACISSASDQPEFNDYVPWALMPWPLLGARVRP